MASGRDTARTRDGQDQGIDHRAVLDASPNAILAVDADGLITYANPRAETTFGWSIAELLGTSIERLIPETVADRHHAHRASFAADPVARPIGVGMDVAGLHRDGSEFPVEISLSPVQTDDGLVVFATIVDIGTRKALETQLLQAQKMESIGRLAGGIAHDFNNMLFAIRGYADILLEDVSASENPEVQGLRPSVEAIGTAADRAAEMASQLLTFSRQQVVTSSSLDPNEAIRQIEPMLRPA